MPKKPVSAETLYDLQFSSDPQFSPDGTFLVYVQTTIHREENKYQSVLHRLHLGTNLGTHLETDLDTRITTGLGKDGVAQDKLPRFSPAGKHLAFVSNRTGKPQVYVMPLDGGEPRQVTRFTQGVRSFVWSPDGESLVVVARSDGSQDASDVRVIGKLRYWTNGEGFYGDAPLRLWRVSLNGEHITAITDGPYDTAEPAFSQNGEKIAFVSWRKEDELEVTPSLYTLELETDQIEEIAVGKGSIHSPSFSPDGRWIAFFGHQHGESPGYHSEVWIVPADGGAARSLTGKVDRSQGNHVGTDARYDSAELSPVWSEDSQRIFFTLTDSGDCLVYSADLDGEVRKESTGNGCVINSFARRGGLFAFAMETPTCPAEIYIQQGETLEQQAFFNRALEDYEVSVPERIQVNGAEQWDIEGWILKPPGFRADVKYPLVVEIHGGPHSSYGNTFHHEFQVLASSGYVVLYTNPRGSHGYGEEFMRGCIGDWGGKDYEDIMKATDDVVGLPFIDGEKLFVTGGSYGGYMTNWIVSHTNRFRAAITQRSICNLYSMYGTSDIGFWFNRHELGNVNLWSDEEFIMSRSPIRYAPNVSTPTKILPSEQDIRCPMEQAEQWFTALKLQGVDTELVRFPNENHDLSRNGQPFHRIERLNHIVSWFDRHCS